MGVLHNFSQHLPLLHCQLCKQPTQQNRNVLGPINSVAYNNTIKKHLIKKKSASAFQS